MTKREARRLAILVAVSELEAGLDVSDEWYRHPETDMQFTPAEVAMVKDAAAELMVSLIKRVRR